MSAKPNRQAKLPETAHPKTRKATRHSVRGMLVAVRGSQGDQATAQLNDFSAFGCNIVTDAAWLRMGCFISLRLSDDVTVQAIVRWVRDGACGVEFLRPLPYADAEAFARGC